MIDEPNSRMSGSTASTTATTRAAAKLLIYGIRPKALTTTPATEPMVLTKNTRPAPASARSPRVADWRRNMATSSGFIAEVTKSGTNSSTIHAIKAPTTRSNCASR